MKRPKLAATLILLILLSSVSLAGCTRGSQQSQSGKTKAGSSGNASSAGVKVNLKGFPIVNKPITLTMFGRRAPQNGPWNKMLLWKAYAKMTNIQVKFKDLPTQGFKEKKNLVFASKDLPDAFIRASITPQNQVKYGSDGILIPLDSLIKKDAPNLQALFKKYPQAEKQITAPDGHIYALPGMVTLLSARTEKPWINMKWLNHLHLQVPQTTDQLEQVLKAFKNNDPNQDGKNDTVPILARDLNSLITSLQGSWGLTQQMGYYINIQNGKVNIWVGSDKYKSLLMYLHKLYQEKLIPSSILTQTRSQWLSSINSGKVGMFFIQTSNTFSKVQDQYEGMAPVKGPYGDRLVGHVSPVARTPGVFAITKKDKYPDATMKWVDYFYGREGSIFFRYGVKGKTYHLDSNGNPVYNDSIKNSKKSEGFAIGQFAIWPGGATPEWINDQNSTAINPAKVQQATDKLKPYVPKVIYGPPLFDKDTNKTVQNITTDLDTYIQEQSAKFVTGDLSFSKWNDYVNTLKKLKIDQLQQIYQKAFDRMKAK